MEITKPHYTDRNQVVRYPKSIKQTKQIEQQKFSKERNINKQQNIYYNKLQVNQYKQIFLLFLQVQRQEWRQKLIQFYQFQQKQRQLTNFKIKQLKQNRNQRMQLIRQFWMKFKKDIHQKYRHHCNKDSSGCKYCQIKNDYIKQFLNQQIQKVDDQHQEIRIQIRKAQTQRNSQNQTYGDIYLDISKLEVDNILTSKKPLKVSNGLQDQDVKTSKSIKNYTNNNQMENTIKSTKRLKNEEKQNQSTQSPFSFSMKKIANSGTPEKNIINNQLNINGTNGYLTSPSTNNMQSMNSRKQIKKKTALDDQNLSKIYRKDKDIYTKRKSKEVKKPNNAFNFHKSKGKIFKKSQQKQKSFQQTNQSPIKASIPSSNGGSQHYQKKQKQPSGPIIKINKPKKQTNLEQSSQVKQMRDLINSKTKKKKGLVRINSKRIQSIVFSDSSFMQKQSTLQIQQQPKKKIIPLSKYEKQRAFYHMVRQDIPQSFYLKKIATLSNNSHIKFRKQSIQLDPKQLQNMKPSRKRSLMKKMTRFQFEKSCKDYNIDLIKIKQLKSSILDLLDGKSLKNVKQKIQKNFNQTTLTNTNIKEIYKFYMYTQYQIACNLKALQQSSVQSNTLNINSVAQSEIYSINKFVSNLDIQEDDLIVNINCQVNQEQMKSVQYSIKYYSNQKIRQKVINLIEWDQGKKINPNNGMQLQQISMKNILLETKQ